MIQVLTKQQASPAIMDHTTMSSFIRLAVEEATHLDRSFYYPNSNFWHMPGTKEADGTKFCTVCFAGAVIANRIPATIGIGIPKDLRDLGLEPMEINRIQALDMLRCGDVIGAMSHMHLDSPYTESQRAKLIGLQHQIDQGRPAAVDPDFAGWEEFDQFLTTMDWLAEKLEQAGL